MKKLFLFLLVPLCMIACNQRLADGWYHVDNILADSIVKPAIITVKDIVDVRLDSAYSETGLTLAVNARISKEKRKVWADATEKAIGHTIAYVFDGKVVTNPMVNMRIEGGRFQITNSDNALIRDIYQRILKDYTPGEANDEAESL